MELVGQALAQAGSRPSLLAVVAEGALEGAAVVGDLGYDAVGAGRDAVAAAVADVGLDVDVIELVADDGACRAGLLARRLDAVLAHVAHESPAPQGVELGPAGQRLRHVLGERYEVDVAGQAALLRVLDERDVAPGRARELLCVVVGVAGQLVAVGRELVPLLAGDLAGLAPYTDRRVGQEPCRHQSSLLATCAGSPHAALPDLCLCGTSCGRGRRAGGCRSCPPSPCPCCSRRPDRGPSRSLWA